MNVATIEMVVRLLEVEKGAGADLVVVVVVEPISASNSAATRKLIDERAILKIRNNLRVRKAFVIDPSTSSGYGH